MSLPIGATRSFGFFGRFVKNLKEEMEKTSEFKGTIKQLEANSEDAKKEGGQSSLSKGLEDLKAKLNAASERTKKATSSLTTGISSTFGSLASAIGKRASGTTSKVVEVGSKATKAVADVLSRDEALRKTGEVAQKGAEVLSESTAVITKTTGKVASKASEVIGKSKVGQVASSVSEIIEKERQEAEKDAKPKTYEANENAGTGLQMYEETQWEKVVNKAKKSDVYQSLMGMRASLEDSENPIVMKTLDIQDAIYARVSQMMTSDTSESLKVVRQRDPTFSMYYFLDHVKEEMIPQFVEADCRSDMPMFQKLCIEPVWRQLGEIVKARKEQGLVMESIVTDISDVEILKGNIHQGDPELLVQFSVQQTAALTNAKGEIVEGAEDEVRNNMFLWRLRHDRDTLSWKIAETALISSEFLY